MYDTLADLGMNSSRQEASDHAGAAADERAANMRRFADRVPVSQLAGVYGADLDTDTDPAEWFGEPSTIPE
jgi:hypothetical protein